MNHLMGTVLDNFTMIVDINVLTVLLKGLCNNRPHSFSARLIATSAGHS